MKDTLAKDLSAKLKKAASKHHEELFKEYSSRTNDENQAVREFIISRLEKHASKGISIVPFSMSEVILFPSNGDWKYVRLHTQDFLSLNACLDIPLKMRFVEDKFYQDVQNSYADIVLVYIV